MKKISYLITILLIILAFSGCNTNNSVSNNPQIETTKVNSESQKIADSTLLAERGSLTSEEKALFSKIAFIADLPFIYENDVIRYYKIDNGEKVYIFNTMVFSKKEGVIMSAQKKTDYVYYDLSFSGDPSPMSSMIINFKFSQGAGYHGVGSIIKEGDEIIKSYIACGTGGCTKEVIK
jgi:hypothetical protein